MRVKPVLEPIFPERLMKVSGSQLAVGNLFIVKVHDYEQIAGRFSAPLFQQGADACMDDGLSIDEYFSEIIGTFWFRTQHRRSELALHLVLGATRRQLWGRLHQEGLWLLTLSALPAWVVCYRWGKWNWWSVRLRWSGVGFVSVRIGNHFIC